MSKPSIFISYSHQDERFKDHLSKQLRVLQLEKLLDAWDDRQIEFGDDWHPRILDAINSATAAVLLISADFLTSKFIATEEIPILLRRRESDGLKLFPVIVKYCPWQRVAWLQGIQCRPKDGKPLADLNTSKRDRTLSAIAIEILDILNSLQAKSAVASAASSPTLHLPSRKLFVGRQELLLQIEDRLQSNQPIGLVGSPGMGKSALALETAYRCAERFPDGCFWVDLRGNDASSAIINLLRSLGRSDELKFSFEELCRLATNEFANKLALLILDNAEGIDDHQRDQLAAICPRTIITSRRAISRNHDLRIDKLSSEDALAIFRQSGIEVDEEPREAQKLIERLGWLALAVVSTARRMSLNSPPQSCAQALTELSEGATLMEKLQLPRRHTLDDTVAESFALSYRELDNELQAAFHALGLCAPSGASAQAIAAMLETTEAEARELLLVLAERSLIEFDGERAEMHPLMHEYAETQVQQQVSQKQAIILRHVKYFGLEIGGAYKKVLGNEDGEDRELKQIDIERDNVRLAQIRALEDGFADPELAVELTIGMEFYWRLRDEPGVFDWLCCAHKLAKQVGSNLGQANVLQAIGDVQSFRKEMDAALGSYDAALKLFKQVGDNLGQANVQKAIGDVQSFRDEKDAALGSYDAALKLFKQVGSNLGQANVLLTLARTNGDAEHYEAAIRLYEKIGDRYSIALGKAHFGDWLLDQDEREKAVPLLQEAKAGWQQIGFEPGVNWMDELLSAQTDNADD